MKKPGGRHNWKQINEREKFSKKLENWQAEKGLNNCEAARKLGLSDARYYTYKEGMSRPKDPSVIEKKMK